MNDKKPHGGKRPNSGRKKGSGKGRIAVTRSISMMPETWQLIDSLRGKESRGKYLARLLG